MPILRLALDVNVWISYALAVRGGRMGTFPQALVEFVSAGQMGARPLQLVVSVEMIDTVERVLERLGISPAASRNFGEAIGFLSRAGPERLDPLLLLSGRDQFALHDREDAGVLAAAYAGRASVLATDDLDGFLTSDCERFDTSVAEGYGRQRQLFAATHERADGVKLVVAHTIDVVSWAREGFEFSPESIRRRYG